MRLTLFAFMTLACCAQQPNVAAQKEAMRKLSFLAGKWTGPAAVLRGPGEPMKLTQTEDVEYKLDGLVMTIEGESRDAQAKIVFRAFAVVSYDDAAHLYRFRAYNDGRYLDAPLMVGPNAFSWIYETGPVKVANMMHLDEKGQWVETTETQASPSPPRKSLEMTLRRQP